MLALLSSAQSARAEASPADIATAKALVVEGRSLREKGTHASARDRFKAAFALVQTPIIGLDLAREHVALQELIEAREVAIVVTKLPENPKESAEGRAARVEAAKLANELAPRIGALVLRVDSMPQHGVVSVDGATMPKEMLGVQRKVNPGKHVVLAVAPGVADKRVDVFVKEGEVREIVIRFSPATVASTGASEVGSSPPNLGTKPSRRDDVPSDSGSTYRVIGVATGVVGLVALGTGLFVGVSARAKYDDAVSSASCRAGLCSSDEIQRAENARSLSNVGLALKIVGGVALTAGVALWVLAPSPKGPTTPTTALIIGPQGLALGGSF